MKRGTAPLQGEKLPRELRLRRFGSCLPCTMRIRMMLQIKLLQDSQPASREAAYVLA